MRVKQSTVTPVVPFVHKHATLVTGDERGTAIGNATVIVGADGLIEYAGLRSQVPEAVRRHSDVAEYRTPDGSGQYLMPGLINAHTHLFSDGRPLPEYLLKESTDAFVSQFLHNPNSLRGWSALIPTLSAAVPSSDCPSR